ncbi:MAG: serine/threonine protein kinase [Myxococcota bacterium]|jgi:serine/threonine protein kinase
MLREPFRFTFDRCLGMGGFGEVYLAYQHRPGGLVRKVAVKILKADLGDEEGSAVRRLQDEGRMLAMLDHPSIIGVLELTHIAGRLALVTQYVGGVDLGSRTTPRRLLPSRAVLGVAAGVAEALHCAWTTVSTTTGEPLHLIHRDIKPQNIRVSSHGEVKLLDFGIARTTQMYRQATTEAGEVPFTPGYSPPESFVRGETESPADIYALGVTVLRLLTGHKLLADMSLHEVFLVMRARDRYELILDEQLDLLSEAVDDALAPQVRDLVADMLAWDPDVRPNAAEVARRAEVLVDGMAGLTLKRWARASTLAEASEPREGPLSGQTLPEDTVGETIAVIPGVIPGGPATIPPHVAEAMSPELLAIAETAMASNGASLPAPEGGLKTLGSVFASGTLPAANIEPVKVERRKEAPGSSTNTMVNVVVAFGIFVVVTVPLGSLVVLFFAWLRG